jgi:hypothetical protein
MKKIYPLLLFLFMAFNINAQITVDCEIGPVNTNFCYGDNANEEFVYTSNDGSPLNLVVNSGGIEDFFDQFIVLDSDGSQLYFGSGNNGDLSGLNFQSSGDTITVQLISDFIISCQDDNNIEPIDLQVTCATCVNPNINFELVDDCLNAPQFFVEADVVDLGSAEDLTITDNQGNPVQTVTSPGIFSFGPYPNGTIVELTADNNQDVNCQVVSQEFTQEICTTNLVDCAEGPVNTSFCYDSTDANMINYVSSDGSVLNLVVNSGFVQEHFALFIVIDSDGTELYNGFGNQGDLSGLNFQSSGDSISVQVNSFFGSSCQNNENIDPIDFQVSCATCENPDISFELVEDCLNGPQFFVEANIADLGSAEDLTITDNQGNPAQIASASGVLSFGPYPNGTNVQLTAENNQDANCQIISEEFSQEACTTNLVDCSVGPVSTSFCYGNDAIDEYTYVSNDGSVLNLVVNSGSVEEHFDLFVVIDSDGTILYNDFGNNGDLSGLNFQSSGDTITVQVISDFTINCQDSPGIDPIELQVSCATCINPDINFELVDDCINAPQFFVEANVTDLGSAEDLTITDNQGNPAQTASSAGVISFGPYPNGTIVELTAENNQDVNCQIVSQEFTQDICTTNLVDCTEGPVNTSFCYGSEDNNEINYVSSDGSVLNLVVNSGFVQEHFAQFVVIDSDGTELYNGFGNQGDLSGLNFQSSGDNITVLVNTFFGASCQDNEGFGPIDLQVSCATCENPDINFELVEDCLNGPQFFVEANVTDLGSAEDLTITDNQGNPAQTASSTGVLSFGPYPNGTIVQLTAENNQDDNCQITSDEFTQEACTTTLVDCAAGPVITNFCYEDSAIEEYTFVSNDGSSLNLVVNSGGVENHFDLFVVIDSDGTILYNGFGNNGDLSGLSFQSSGGSITVQVISDFIINCQDDSNIDPIELEVSCATCTNPEINFELVDDCLNAPQFFVEANVIDLGSAEDITITDNQGNPSQTASSSGVFSFGPYPNGTVVELTAVNNQDANCQFTSEAFTQEECTTTLVDCEIGRVTDVFCYDNNAIEEFTYVSSDGSQLLLVINSGNIEVNFDQFMILDSDGTELYNGFGDEGDLSGLNFLSSGDSITVRLISDFMVSCQDNDDINPIDLSVSCSSFNIVTGHVFYDELGDGCNENDHEMSNYMVEISDGTQSMSVAVNENGQYSAALLSGTYNLSVLNINDDFTPNLASQTISFAGETQILEDVDFCITTESLVEDMTLDISPLGDAVPGDETTYQVLVTNSGTHVTSQAQISFEYDDNLQSFVSGTTMPAENSDNLLIFNLNDIEPFSTKSFEITMLNAASPILTDGEILTFTTEVLPHNDETNIEDNTVVHQQMVANSHNSNDIMVVQGEEIMLESTDQYLNYRIRYQNVASTIAWNVNITNTISDKLDWTTFHPTSSSHNYRVEIIDGQINYYFDNINLPNQAQDSEGSQGYITYKIKPKSSIQVGDIIENTANIYFNSDDAVITNTATTTVVSNLDVAGFEINQISLYPNPVEDILNINLPAQVTLESTMMFDLTGKLVLESGNQSMIEMSNLSDGTYILRIMTDKGELTKKIIKK